MQAETRQKKTYAKASLGHSSLFSAYRLPNWPYERRAALLISGKEILDFVSGGGYLEHGNFKHGIYIGKELENAGNVNLPRSGLIQRLRGSDTPPGGELSTLPVSRIGKSQLEILGPQSTSFS